MFLVPQPSTLDEPNFNRRARKFLDSQTATSPTDPTPQQSRPKEHLVLNNNKENKNNNNPYHHTLQTFFTRTLGMTTRDITTRPRATSAAPSRATKRTDTSFCFSLINSIGFFIFYSLTRTSLVIILLFLPHDYPSREKVLLYQYFTRV